MLGHLDYSRNTATVIGAGISGLLIGYRLKQLGFEVQILEASNRYGGLIQTLHTPYGIAERAAHSLLVNETMVPFFRELGLKLVPLNEEAKARFIVRAGKPRRMPLSAPEIFSTITRAFKAPEIHGELDSLTLEQWGEAYLGKSAVRYLLAPFVTGIFAAQPSDLSAKATFPRLVPSRKGISIVQHFRQLKKSHPKPKSRMMTLEKGLQSLTDALAFQLRNELHLNTPVESVAGHLDHGNVVLTTPTDVTARLLENLDPKSSSLLSQVRYSPLVTATAFFDKKSFHRKPPRGVGFLIPRSEPYRLLGVLFNSSAFAGRVTSDDLVSVTAMVGGTADPEALALSDIEIQNLIETELQELVDLRGIAKTVEITRWSRAIPLFDPSLQFARDALRAGFCSTPGRVVFSNYSNEVSIRGMIENCFQIERP
jgi:oxygen-dependent protoporphyrinogen oxidase